MNTVHVSSYHRRLISMLTAFALLVSISMLYLPVVNAAQVTSLSNVMSSQKQGTASNHTLTFTTPSGVAAAETITLTFPSGFTIGSVDHTDIDVTDDGADLTLGATASGATWGAAFSSQVLTITSGTGTIAASSVIVVEIGTNATSGATGDQQITNHATAASTYQLDIGGTFGDTGAVILPVLTDDQVSVSATVDPSLTFSISDNTIGFGDLSSSAARYATGDTNGSGSETSAHTLSASTNGTSGYSITVLGDTLTSGSNTITAIGGTAAASSAGSEQFGIRITASGGSGAASSPYNHASNYAYDATSSASDEVAASSSASDTTTFSVRYLGNIGGSTESGSYSATLTYSATGNF